MANKMARNGRFSFVGALTFGKDIKTTSQLGEGKWYRTRANVGVKDQQNMQFLNLEFMHEKNFESVKIFTKDSELVDIPNSMTTDENVMSNAADFLKVVIDTETDFEKKKEYTKLVFKKRNHEMKKEDEKTEEDREKIKEYSEQIKQQAENRFEFIHMKDVIDFFANNKEKLDGKKVKVTGQIKPNYYNGKTTLQYVPNFIEFAEDSVENGLKANIDLFYDKDSIDDDTKGKKMFVNGYIWDQVKNRDTGVKEDKLMPLTVVFDYTKTNDEDENHQMLIDFVKSTFKILNKKYVHKNGMDINVMNGREMEEFDESKLTDGQKTAIALGMKKLEDFKPKGMVYGDRIQELKVVCPDLKAYPEGSQETEIAVKELDEYLMVDYVKNEDNNEVEDNKPQQEEQDQSAMMSKLFG